MISSLQSHLDVALTNIAYPINNRRVGSSSNSSKLQIHLHAALITTMISYIRQQLQSHLHVALTNINNNDITYPPRALQSHPDVALATIAYPINNRTSGVILQQLQIQLQVALTTTMISYIRQS
eukprot:g3268.t1